MGYVSMQKWNSKFTTFEENFLKRYPGYELDQIKRVKPIDKTVDFGKLWEMLTSDDSKLLEEWQFGDAEFFDIKSHNTPETMFEMVSYSSYPRCGNSFLRKYLQNITGIATGSDMSLEFAVDLQLGDFKGEEITDCSVWVKKSHDPKPNLGNKVHKANKILCCVRNPYDCITSLMHFLATLNHGA